MYRYIDVELQRSVTGQPLEVSTSDSNPGQVVPTGTYGQTDIEASFCPSDGVPALENLVGHF